MRRSRLRTVTYWEPEGSRQIGATVDIRDGIFPVHKKHGGYSAEAIAARPEIAVDHEEPSKTLLTRTRALAGSLRRKN
jgi:hypothetical protein